MTGEELSKAAAEHPDLNVREFDSMNAGVCVERFRAFLREFFHGRTSASVHELVPFIDSYPIVREILEYKLQQLPGEQNVNQEFLNHAP